MCSANLIALMGVSLTCVTLGQGLGYHTCWVILGAVPYSLALPHGTHQLLFCPFVFLWPSGRAGWRAARPGSLACPGWTIPADWSFPPRNLRKFPSVGKCYISLWVQMVDVCFSLLFNVLIFKVTLILANVGHYVLRYCFSADFSVFL